MNKAEGKTKHANAPRRGRRYSFLSPSSLCIFLLRVYKLTLSPLITFMAGPAGACRFEPTCSQYAIEAIKTHGTIRGGWLATKRICRCHPGGAGGEDPVPPKLGRDGAPRRHRAVQARNMATKALSFSKAGFRI